MTLQPILDSLDNIESQQLSSGYPPFSLVDFEVARDFLQQYNANKATFDSYRREVERLLQWSWLIKNASILRLNRTDIQQYIEFCLSPPKEWIGLLRVSRFIEKHGERRPNPVWRPFVVAVSKADFKKGIKPDKNKYQLSQKAIREIFTILSSFYNYLVLEEKTDTNPIALIRQKSKYLQKTQHQVQVMRLTQTQWQACLDTANHLAETLPEQHERTLFILSLLYLLYLRISELVANTHWTPQMKHFYQDSLGSWWFKMVGKGNKLRTIAVSDTMLAALKRYRTFLRLTPLPSSKDNRPLLAKTRGKGSMTDSRHIRRVVQLCFDKTIEKLREQQLFAEADALESATVHWLRHTGISDDINQRKRPIAHVRDDAGHSSSAITDRYNNIELKERYKSAKEKKLSKAL